MTTKDGNEKAALYTDLRKHCKRQDYERCLKISNEIFRKYPEESRAFHCKIVSLVHLDKYEDCLYQLKHNPEFAKPLMLEKAYCEYRLNRIQEAYQTLQNVDLNKMSAKELLGQVLYRMERYEESYDCYRALMKGHHDDYGLERQANMAAVVAMMHSIGSQKVGKQKFFDETHELQYNVTCALVAQGKFEEALKKLDEAADLCKETLAEDGDELLHDELAPIMAQKGYVLHRLGRTEEANNIYHQLTKQRPNDPAVLGVVANNIVCLNKDQNVFDSKKRIKVATADVLKHKMHSAQRRTIFANHALLALHTNQGDLCRRLTSQLSEKEPARCRAVLISAAQLLKEKQAGRAAEFLQENVSRMQALEPPAADSELLQLQMALAQVYLQQEKLSACCGQLRHLDPVSRPGVLGSMVSLYEGEEDIDSAVQLLQDAGRHAAKGDESILQASAHFHLRHSRFVEAAALYENLHRAHPDDQRVLARLIHAYSNFDKKKAELASRDLNLDQDEKNVDVDALETTFLYGSKHMRKALTADKTPKTPPTNEQLLLKSRKRKKKNKPPKVIDPSVPIDPERWIPKRERSYYRPKKKDKRKENIYRGPQGQTEGAASLDITASPKASPVEAPKPKQQPPSAKSSSKSGAKGRKKKR